MLNEIIDIIKGIFSPSIEVTGDTTIKNDLRLDSFDIANLISILEEKYKINVYDTDLFSLVTVNDISNYIKNWTKR